MGLFLLLVGLAWGLQPLLAQEPAQLPVAAVSADAPQPAPLPTTGPPPANATAEQLEATADLFRARKAYTDAIEYYEAAAAKATDRSSLYNKAGIAFLLEGKSKEARNEFNRAIKLDG